MSVHAAAITRDELEWPVDRLPAIPSYELFGSDALGPDVSDLAVDDAVWALTGFDRDGAAAEYPLVPASFLAPKPRPLGHLESAAIPLAGPSTSGSEFVLENTKGTARPATLRVVGVSGNCGLDAVAEGPASRRLDWSGM